MTAEQVKNKDLKNILFNLRDEIIQGKRLGNAMEAYPQVFDNTYVSLIKAGDTQEGLLRCLNHCQIISKKVYLLIRKFGLL